jgi:hypothetical protein
MIDACGSRLSWSLMEGCSEGRGNPTLITTSEFGAYRLTENNNAKKKEWGGNSTTVTTFYI